MHSSAASLPPIADETMHFRQLNAIEICEIGPVRPEMNAGCVLRSLLFAPKRDLRDIRI